MARNVEDELNLLPGFLIRRAHQISTSILNCELTDLGITPSQLVVLMAIDARPGCDQITIANIAKLDQSTMTLVMTKLERDAFVTREPDQVDRRRKTLWITPGGREVLSVAKTHSGKARETQLSIFSRKEAVELMRLLRKFVESFEDGASSSPDR